MKQLTPIEIQKAQILKAYRAAIRLKYSLKADAEIARRLPEIEKEIDRALASSDALELTPSDVWDEVG